MDPHGSTLRFYNLHHRNMGVQNWGIYVLHVFRVWVGVRDLSERATGLHVSSFDHFSLRAVPMGLGRILFKESAGGISAILGRLC